MGRECLGAVHKIEEMLQMLLGCKDTIAVVWGSFSGAER
jgi:hypothetical protein